jgi:hypothetical protein
MVGFTQMQLGHNKLKNVTGLTFYKLLGSGAKKWFSAVPNLGLMYFLYLGLRKMLKTLSNTFF